VKTSPHSLRPGSFRAVSPALAANLLCAGSQKKEDFATEVQAVFLNSLGIAGLEVVIGDHLQHGPDYHSRAVKMERHQWYPEKQKVPILYYINRSI